MVSSCMLFGAPQWGAADAEIKVSSSENTELKRSPFKAWSHHHHYHHQSLNRESRWGTTDDCATSFLVSDTKLEKLVALT